MALVEEQVYRDRRHLAGTAGQILDRARFLADRDRAIVQKLARGDLYQREVAQMLGIPEYTLTRRLQRLWRRLADPRVSALIDNPLSLSPEVRQIGIEHFLQGLSARAIAQKHRMPATQVRRIVGFVREWFKGRVQGSGFREGGSEGGKVTWRG
jgi:DNA-directed RNA polymerase specialized sigma24 family protein